MISWGFLGAGWIATKALAPAVHQASNATLLAVASQDRDRAQALNPKKVYDGYQELLEDPEVDAVYINLANHQHYEWTIAALAAGKHVLCEKPLGLDHAQSEKMANAAVQYDRVLVEAVWSRWHPRFARIVELINSGNIGAIKRIESAFTFTGEMNGNYRLNPNMGGGSLLDVGVYQTHVWSALVHGESELSITSSKQKMSSTGVDLTTAVIATLGTGIEVSALSSFEMAEEQRLVITGELTTIECVGNDAFTSWHSPSLLRIGDRVEEFAPTDPYRIMIENFGSHISGKPAWIPGIDQTLYVARLLDQIKEFGV